MPCKPKSYPSWPPSFFCYHLPLKVPSGQIESASEWYHWKGLEKDINRYRFLIFLHFGFEYLKRLQSSEPLHTKMHLILLLIGRTGGHKPQSFPPNRSPKMRESQQLFLGLRLVSRIFEENQQPAIQTKIDSCPQNWDHGLRLATRYPNLKRGAPAVFGVRFGYSNSPNSKKDDKICQTEQINQ